MIPWFHHLPPPGRIKDVIITSGGKNIAPYPIEEKIKAELGDFVSNCVVVGDKQKHLACLLTVRAVHDPLTMEATPQVGGKLVPQNDPSVPQPVFTITEKATTRAGFSIVSYSHPSLIIIVSLTQFHVERPWGQCPFSIVS